MCVLLGICASAFAFVLVLVPVLKSLGVASWSLGALEPLMRATMRKDEKRTKQAQQGAQIGQWVVLGGVITIMGLTLDAALASAPADRDLDVVELWAGVGSIARAATRAQYQAAAFDLHRVPGVTDMPGEGCEDLTTLTGFKAATSLVLRLREGGLLALGPDCSSFTFPNSSRHKRNLNDVLGDLSYLPVSIGNLMAVIAVFLCQLAIVRRVHFALENPGDSQFFRFIEEVFPSWVSWRSLHLFSQSVLRCPYDDTPEPKLGKVYKWVSSCPGIKSLQAKCKCQGAHRRLGFTRNDGTGWTGDSGALGESAAYPNRLGEAVLNMWRKHCQPIDADWSCSALALPWADPRSTNQDTETAQQASDVGVKKSRCQVPAPKVANCDPVVSHDLGPWGGSSGVVKQSRRQVPAPAAVDHAHDLGPWGDMGVDVVESSVMESRCQSPLRGEMGPWASLASSSSASTAFGPWSSTAHQTEEASSTTLGPWASLCASSSSSDEAEAAPGQIGSPK